MPTPTATPPNLPVLVSVEAGAARIAADRLADEARKERVMASGDAATSELLNRAASALHAAGWATAVDLDAAAAELNREDVQRGVSVHLPDTIADALLTARGWRIVSAGWDGRSQASHYFVKPNGKPRHAGGKCGADYLWQRDEALALALTAEALEVRS